MRTRRMKSFSASVALAMRLLFARDQSSDFVAMIKEVAQRVDHLGVREVEGPGYLGNRFTPKIKRGYVPHRNSQPVDDWFATANSLQADDVGVFGFHDGGHDASSF